MASQSLQELRDGVLPVNPERIECRLARFAEQTGEDVEGADVRDTAAFAVRAVLAAVETLLSGGDPLSQMLGIAPPIDLVQASDGVLDVEDVPLDDVRPFGVAYTIVDMVTTIMGADGGFIGSVMDDLDDLPVYTPEPTSTIEPPVFPEWDDPSDESDLPF